MNPENPFNALPCGDCGIPFEDHVTEEGAAECDNFHYCQDTASELREDAAALWDSNAALRAELAAVTKERDSAVAGNGLLWKVLKTFMEMDPFMADVFCNWCQRITDKNNSEKI